MQFPTQIDGPIAVIGDVHGQVEKLGIVLDKLQDAPHFDQRWIVFVGDFVDRGPDSREAIEMVLEFMDYHPHTTAVAGNHDLAMAASLDLVETPDYSDWKSRWIDHYDSEATFASYDVPFGDLQGLADALPQTHRSFLSNLPWVVEHPRYIVVHAGLDPLSSLEMQLAILRQRDYSLNRPQWLCEKKFAEDPVPRDCQQTVISGHVWMQEVVFAPRKILCDTSGGVDGDLSAVLLPERMVINSSEYPGMMPALQTSQPYDTPQKSWWKFWS